MAVQVLAGISCDSPGSLGGPDGMTGTAGTLSSEAKQPDPRSRPGPTSGASTQNDTERMASFFKDIRLKTAGAGSISLR